MAYRMGLEPASVRLSISLCVCSHFQTCIYMYMGSSKPITIELYQKHHYGGGLPALGFNAGRVRTLVSIPKNSSHGVLMGKTLSLL